MLRTVVEKMGKFNKYLYLHSFQSGKIELSIENENNLTIKSYFTNLVPKNIVGNNAGNDNNLNETIVLVDCKKLYYVLSFQAHLSYSCIVLRKYSY